MSTTTTAPLYTLATCLDETAYLVAGDRALGPLPCPLWQTPEEVPSVSRPILAHEDLLAAGAAWGPVPDDLWPTAWYRHEDGPAGGRYVSIAEGFQRALAAFLGTVTAGALRTAEPELQTGAVPALVLYPDGRYALAPSGAELPIVVPVVRGGGLDAHVQDYFERSFEARTWQG